MWAGTDALRHMVGALTTAVPVRAVSANGYHLLTARQKQVVALVAEGFSNRDISKRLTLSEHTVKNYLFRIFDKLGVSNRAELIIYTLHRQA
jgi:DNA-binding NarL/FixJ family response regulator